MLANGITILKYDRKNFIIQATGLNVIKLFTIVICKFLEKLKAFAPGKPFQSDLMFVGRARSLP